MYKNLLALLLLFAGPLLVQASEVRDKVTNIARDIARLLRDENQTEVAIGEVTGPPLPQTSAGPMIQSALIEELVKLKVGHNAGAFVFVKGEYFVLEEDKKSEQLIVRLLITLRNKKGKKIDEITADIGYRGNEDLVKLLAINTDLSNAHKADREAQNQQMKKDLAEPPLFIDGTKIKTKQGSPFAVEILAGPEGGSLHLLKPEAREKQAFVPIDRKQEYVLRLSNHAHHEAAAQITIDGVDVFHFFEPAQGRPKVFLIPPGKSIDVKGWLRSSEKTNAFLVGAFANSAAARVLKGSNTVGTITVCFHPAWEVGKPPPEFAGSRSSQPNGTGLGRELDLKTKVVQRTIGPLLAGVSVRYNK